MLLLLNDEIVETVRPNSSADDLQDEEEIIPIIFLTEVLINVENLINLHNFPLENFK
ncbi:9299_t:CDS:2 [Rhizophagus irregularis]|nr:9299_t:CDS:2 [Rhizophagus irregularis]